MRTRGRLRAARTALATALALALCGAASAQALFEWVNEEQQCWLANESVSLRVAGLDGGGQIAWGDGAIEVIPGDGEYSHTYDWGRYFPQLLGEAGEPLNEVPAGNFYEYALQLSSASALPGESMSLTLDAYPDAAAMLAGELRWGDGSSEPAGSPGLFEHAYAAPGAYVVEFLPDAAAPGCAVLAGTVYVEAEPGNPEMTVHPTRAVPGQLITAEVIDEPFGGSIDWADGSLPWELDGSGTYRMGYDMPGEYLVTLLDAAGAPLASQLVTIIAPRLELLSGDPARVGESVTLLAEGIVAPALLDWGDGATTNLPEGGGIVSHTYVAEGLYDIRLVDEFTGDELESLTLEVVVDEPIVANEQFAVMNVDYRLSDGLISVTIDLTGLAAGRNYVLRSEATHTFLERVADSERITVDFHREGSFLLTLERHDTLEERYSLPLTLEWPRATESIWIAGDEPHLLSGSVLFEITGLDPDLTYLFRPNGENGLERRIQGVSRHDERAFYDEAGLHTATLLALYPGGDPRGELRDTAFVEVHEHTGQIELREANVTYGESVTVEASDLVPGARYRVDFGDGTLEEFVAFGATEAFVHTYLTMPHGVLLEGWIGAAGPDAGPLAGSAWTLLDSADLPTGLSVGGELALEQGGTVAGDVQTFVMSGLVPGTDYLFRLDPQEAPDGSNPVQSATVTADEDGAATLAVEIDRDDRALEEHTTMYAFLDAVLSDGPRRVDQMTVLLPPLQRTINGLVIPVTELTQPLVAEEWEFPQLDAKGVVNGLVLGGRELNDVPVLFQNLWQYEVAGPLEFDLPARFAGMSLTFERLVIATKDRHGYWPYYAGSGTLLGTPFTFQSGDPEEPMSVFEDLFYETGELIFLASFEGDLPVGETGWVVSGSATGGHFTVDLSQDATYRVSREGGTRLVQEEAYDPYRATLGAPTPSPATDEWTGVVFNTSGGVSVRRDPNLFRSPGSQVFIDHDMNDIAITWTSSGFNFEYRGHRSINDFRGWETTVVRPYTFGVVDSQIVSEEAALLRFEAPLFEQPLYLGLKPDGGAERNVRVVSSVPVARSFGMTAVIADQPRFVGHGDGTASIAFDRAVWTLDQSLAASGTSLDSTAASRMRASAEALELPAEVESDLSAVMTVIDTAENLLSLHLPLDGLTLGNGGEVSLGDGAWKTLAATPELDLFGFPYLSGANAEIGVMREEGEYAIGLRGGLSLGGIVTATAAPSWYYVKDGEEQRWEFKGVSASLGDPNGLLTLPVTFNLTVGGMVSLAEGDRSLELNGIGEMTVGVSTETSGGAIAKQLINIHVGGVFGLNDSGDSMKPYWFVHAGMDLAAMNAPIPVKVKGVDVFAFYGFHGGIGHNLRLALTTGHEENDLCAVDDGLQGGEDQRPSVVKNARACFDDSNDLALLAGTLIGWFQQGASNWYGLLWHADANLVVNSRGPVILGGRGWAFKTLSDGHGSGATPNMVARLAGNADGILGSFCLGAVGKEVGELDCTGLAPVKLELLGVSVIEAEATAQLAASWSTDQYYFAIGTQQEPAWMHLMGQYQEGYFVAGYLTDPGLIEARVPAAGMWIALNRGYYWNWSYSTYVPIAFCTLTAHAGAELTFGGALGLQVHPSVHMSAGVAANASVTGGVACGKLDFSVNVGIRADGTVSGPNPFGFKGNLKVTAELPKLPNISVNIDNVGFNL